jgi:N4-gp56 family major capsid protein
VPDAYTSTTSLDFDQTMWDRAIYYPLRSELYFDSFADVEPTDAAPPRGSSVTFTTFNDLAAATTPLSETTDVDAVALSDTQVTLTPAEYGNAVVTTFRVRATSFIELNRPVANILGYNAGISQDTLARTIMQAGSNVRYASTATSRATVGAAMTLTSTGIRSAYADLEGANAMKFNGYYAALIHTDQKYDLRGETGAAAWRDPHNYSQPDQIWNGEVGEYEGFRFMSSPRAPLFVDAGVTSTVDVYGALFFGRQAIAKVYSTWEGRGPFPITIMGPVTDKLKRLQPVGWHWYGVYGRFREASLRRLETSSSRAVNV